MVTDLHVLGCTQIRSYTRGASKPYAMKLETSFLMTRRRKRPPFLAVLIAFVGDIT